jgi:hypothetical protein
MGNKMDKINKKRSFIVSGVLLVLIALILSIKLTDYIEYKRRISFFPLSKGTYWIYQGPTKWMLNNSNKVVEKTLTWKMEVIDTIQKGQYFIAVLKGHPSDLAWYEEGKSRGDYLLIRKGTSKYYLAFDTLMKTILDKAKTNPKLLDDLLDDYSAFIDLPLTAGKKYGDPEQVARPDNAYCWFVESVKNVSLNDIKGLSSNPTVTQYQLRFDTLPDQEEMKIVDGIGITEYKYVHHGTVSETDLRLIEFHRGAS